MVEITFLGTNGWFPTETGQTASVLVETEDKNIVFDAGSGFSRLREHGGEEKPLHIFLSHYHIDHIQGLHCFDAVIDTLGIEEVHIYGQEDLEEVMDRFLSNPFTASIEEFNADIELHPLEKGEHKIEDLDLQIRELEHSDPCYGYALKVQDHKITYCTDTGPCDATRELAQNAEVLIHEAAWREDEEGDSEWPHTRPKEAARIAVNAGVKYLYLFQFDGMRYDSIEEREKAVKSARTIFPNTRISKDSTHLQL